MQTNVRYFTAFKLVYFLPILLLTSFNLYGLINRNPFCFSDKKINIPFSCSAIAQVHNSSKYFAILTHGENQQRQNFIAKKGETILGYRIVDIFGDAITIQDNGNNEIILHLK